MVKPIRSAEDHAEALAEIDGLMGAPDGGAEAERLQVLAVLVADYERRAFEDPPEPADVLETAMQMQGRTQAELSQVLGSRARASEVLARRRGLSAEQADRVAEAWRLPLRLLGGTTPARRKARTAAGAAVLAAVVLTGACAAGFLEAARDLPDVAPVVALAEPRAGRVDVRRLPPHVYQAVLAAQDGRFFAHAGYDGASMAEAAAWNVDPRHWSRPAGASTLTQQLAKTQLLKGEKKGVRRKIREILLARQIEAKLDKEQIISAWLNAAPFGGEAVGLANAAHTYFGVDPQELTVGEAAYLAAVPNAPSRLRIDQAANLDRARVSRDRVVHGMVRQGYLTPAAADLAAREGLGPQGS